MSSRKRPHGETIEGGRLWELQKLILIIHKEKTKEIEVKCLSVFISDIDTAKCSRINEVLRHGHIEGVCEKIHKGTVRVGFWVGNCAGYKSADAQTGWNSVSRIYVEEVPPPKA